MFAHDATNSGYTATAGPTASPIQLWHANLDIIGGRGSPTIADGLVFMGDDGHLYAFNASNGATVWAFNEGDNYEFRGAPAVANGMVYDGSLNGTIYAFNENTGQIIWDYSITGDDFAGSPVVVGMSSISATAKASYLLSTR
jgi:outer membrane protein assembly factor BamB